MTDERLTTDMLTELLRRVPPQTAVPLHEWMGLDEDDPRVAETAQALERRYASDQP